MNEEDKRRIWRRILGYRIGEKVSIRYKTPVLYNEEEIGIAQIFIEGTVVGIKKNSIIIETKKGTRIELKESLLYG